MNRASVLREAKKQTERMRRADAQAHTELLLCTGAPAETWRAWRIGVVGAKQLMQGMALRFGDCAAAAAR